jgi:hypothetical protein
MKPQYKGKKIARVRWNGIPLDVDDFLRKLHKEPQLRDKAIEIWGRETVERLMRQDMSSGTIELMFEQATMF